MLVDLHDHEHPRAEQINLQVFDTRILDALCDFRPNLFMMPSILSNQLRIVFQVESQAVSFAHLASMVTVDASFHVAARCGL